ncbi:hypothetical protein [Cryobacterium breve]|uniref:hypothetical protein n=1 Tax=Cryobacterium breve TaxID=1259258 RepID=UPI0032B288B9
MKLQVTRIPAMSWICRRMSSRSSGQPLRRALLRIPSGDLIREPDVLDRAVVVDRRELFLEDVDLRHHLVGRELVGHHEARELGLDLVVARLFGVALGLEFGQCRVVGTGAGLASVP